MDGKGEKGRRQVSTNCKQPDLRTQHQHSAYVGKLRHGWAQPRLPKWPWAEPSTASRSPIPVQPAPPPRNMASLPLLVSINPSGLRGGLCPRGGEEAAQLGSPSIRTVHGRVLAFLSRGSRPVPSPHCKGKDHLVGLWLHAAHLSFPLPRALPTTPQRLHPTRAPSAELLRRLPRLCQSGSVHPSPRARSKRKSTQEQQAT